jgi:uncharacterized membrane protein
MGSELAPDPDGSRLIPEIVCIALILPCVGFLSSWYNVQNLLLLVFLVIASTALLIVTRRSSLALGDANFLALICSISLTLLLSSSVSSPNLWGYDVNQEFHVFSQVLQTGFWNTGVVDRLSNYNTLLSVTILPTIISLVTEIPGIPIFKYVFPTIFAVTPVILYKIYRKILNPDLAFISVLFWMMYPAFYETMIQLARQEIAELLLVLLMYLFLSYSGSPRRSDAILVSLLTLGLITSHYTLAFIYMLVITGSLAISRFSHSRLASDRMVMLSAIITIAWYLLVGGGVLLTSVTGLMSFTASTIAGDFFAPGSRPVVVLQAFGAAPITPGFWHQMNRLIQLTAEACIGVGFFAFLCRRHWTLSEKKMLPFMIAGMAILNAAIVAPYFAGVFTLIRFYHVALLFICPCIIYGVNNVASVLHRFISAFKPIRTQLRVTRLLLATLVILYFLFTSGWVWPVLHDTPTDLVLDKERIMNSTNPTIVGMYYRVYPAPQEIEAASWLSSHMGEQTVCADHVSTFHVLNSYANLPRTDPILPSECPLNNQINQIIYLNIMNTRYQLVANGDQDWSPISPQLNARIQSKNRVYSDGGPAVYS